MIIKIITELRRRMDEDTKNFNKQLKIIKKEPDRAEEYNN